MGKTNSRCHSSCPEESYTKVINQHIPPGFCLYSKFAYGKVENPLKLYRWKDCVKFLITLKTKPENFITCFKPMKPLTRKERRKYIRATKCHMCFKGFKKNGIKVRDHCPTQDLSMEAVIAWQGTKQCKLRIKLDGIYVRMAGWLCLKVLWDANEAEISLSPVHLLPERSWFQAPMKMHNNLAPMPNPNMADYVRDCALPVLHQCKKTAKWTFSSDRKKENGAWSARF